MLLSTTTPALATDLSTREWTVDGPQSLKNSPPTQEDVNTLISKALNADWKVKTCNFKFADLAQDGYYRLIAAFDGSGYHTCNRVVVIEKKGARLAVANDWQTRLAQKVDNILIDLDRDGRLEIIVPEAWSKYEIGRCIAMWQKIYKWEDGHYIDHSTDYPALYTARQKQLEDTIPRLRDPTCDQMELDKIARFLGISPKAGFAQAETWMKNPEPFMRRKAAAVFADINDTESRKNLAILKSDSDALVAESARLYLESSSPH